MNSVNLPYSVKPTFFSKCISLPTSKSHANRALILGAILGNDFKILNISDSSDVKNLSNVLRQLGLEFIEYENSLIFTNSFPACEEKLLDQVYAFETGDGGTTNRFLVALLSLGKKTYQLFPSEKLAERPIDDLLTPLRSLGVKINKNINGSWLEITGPLNINNKNEIFVNCSQSTQFATALKLATINKKITIKPENLKSSQAYLEMTDVSIKLAIEKNEYDIPVDFSSLSYPVTLASLNGDLLIENCFELDTSQADSCYIDILKKIGSDIEFTNNGLRCSSKKTLLPFCVDGSKCPDLVPALVVLASKIMGESTISHIGVLKHKESDRVSEILNLLSKFQVKFTYDSLLDELRIFGSEKKADFIKLDPPRDHRIVMAAYLFMKVNNGGELLNTDCVNKSYPNFLSDME